MAREQAHTGQEAAHAPEGSFWPIVLAGTLTLTLVGLVVHFVVALIGGVLSIGAIAAWVVERFQGPAQEGVPAAERAHLPALDAGEADVELPVVVGRTSVWWGLVWFITTEALFFANMIVAYLFLRLGLHGHPPPQMPHMDLFFPSVNTVILLLSGVPAYFGLKAMKRGNIRGLQIGFVLSALLGAIFLGGQGWEYVNAVFPLQTNVLTAGFFVLTGFHGIHVIVGVGLLLFVTARSFRSSAQSHFSYEVASTYWHFVDLVWIFLFAILYVFQ